MKDAIETTHREMLKVLQLVPIEELLLALIQENIAGKPRYTSAILWRDTHYHTADKPIYHRAMPWSFEPRPEFRVPTTQLSELLETPNLLALASIRWTLKLHTRRGVDGYLQFYMNVGLNEQGGVVNFQPVAPLTMAGFKQALLAGFHRPLHQLEMDDD